MFLSRILLVMILAVEYIDGNQKIINIHVSDNATGDDNNSEMCCVHGNCSCNSLDQALANLTNNVMINITTDVTFSSFVTASNLENVTIIGHINPIVNCERSGRIHLTSCRNCIIQGIVWNGYGTKNTDNDTEPMLKLNKSSNVKIQNCTFQNLIGQAIVLSEVSGEVNIKDCNFVNNSYYRDHGAIVYYVVSQYSQLLFTIINCNFTHNKGAKSLVYIENKNSDFNITFHHSNFCHNKGTSIYAVNQKLYFTGKVLFQYNTAENGAGIYITQHSSIVFSKNSNAAFIQNTANYTGGAVFLRNHSNIIFDQDSIITFQDNSATNGTIYSKVNSNVTFKANCEVTFNNNSATQCGEAIYSSDNSHITFTENSNVKFNNHMHIAYPVYIYAYFYAQGSIVFSAYHSYITITGNSTIKFCENHEIVLILSFNHSNISFEGTSHTIFSNNINNENPSDGVVYLFDYSHISFAETSTTMFCNNTRAIFSEHGHITFEGNSTTMFSNNSANFDTDGGAIYSSNHGLISFRGISTTVFNNNSGFNGGAIYSSDHGLISFKGNSTTKFNNNSANGFGGAISYDTHGHASFEENSTTVFSNNSAGHDGGAIDCYFGSYLSFTVASNTTFSNNTAHNGGAINFENCRIFFKDNSTTLFKDNNALTGGAMFSGYNSSVSFNEYSTTMFIDNKATDGGALSCIQCIVLFKGSSTVLSAFNEAIENGGVMYFTYNSTISFSEFTNVTFKKNSAINGGALFVSDNSTICFEGNALVTFTGNTAGRNGGAVYFNLECAVIWTQNTNVTFENNDSVFGGAVCLNKYTRAICESYSAVLFQNNTVISEGGAISILTDSSITVKDSTMITFAVNNALYGGAMFFDRTYTFLTLKNNTLGVNFTRNTATIAGNNMYFDLIRSGQNCLNNRTFGVVDEIKRYIVTPPSKLELSYPAICLSYYNKTEECDQYYLNRLMLGEEVIIPVCLRDYCNEPSYSTQRFTLREFSKPNYVISGRTEFLLSCQSDALQDIRIIGNESLTKSLNYSFDVTLNIYGNSNWKQVSINLIIQLTPCYPGFWQYPESQKCECYGNHASDIVSCSSSSSTIKRGYWFGSVNGEPTVSACPINYCNFTCCETSNGHYQLSPVRDNQCRSHRNGTACGSCTDGYTLSFDSTECINTDNCTTGQTILVILATVTYWIIMVAVVFAMMYYKIEIAYLYSITYYYSIVDILQSQNSQTSRGLYVTVSIISSFSKIIPQFLGELCLTTGMSGIDQQFIHYIHPSAVILILVMIIALAKRSRRISTIISRGIIHVICLLLLLSYTSIASTSLLLLGLLQFNGIDEVYTYLSPDIKYFNGRHLAYGIVALLCTASIVIGLPLLLILEPLLNHKLNFVKIKPLLDQFQGCYKDKYRCFAGYYMICRLLIITIVIINSTNEFVANYFLTAACLIIALLHLMVKPYNNETINKLDGIILQIIVLITALPLLDDGFDSAFVTTMAFVLVFLPLIIYIALILYFHKDRLKKLVARLIPKDDPPSSNDIIRNEIAIRNFDRVIDDRDRQSATICDT